MAVGSLEFESPGGVFLIKDSIRGRGNKGNSLQIVQGSTRIFFPGGTERASFGLRLDPLKGEVDLDPCDDVEVYRMGTYLTRFFWMISGWRFPSVLRDGLLIPKVCEKSRHFILADEGETYGIRNIGQPSRIVQVSFVYPSQIPNLSSLDLLR